jgi:Spy/CpxP family protein refolding chaperone
MKKFLSLFSVLLFTFTLTSATPLFANHDGKQCEMKNGQCAVHGADCKMGGDCDSKSGCPIAGKFNKKAKMILANKSELGLSAEQVQTIEALKSDVEKGEIRQMADMQIFMVDMTNKLQEDTVDVEGLNAMIDKGSAAMSQSAKEMVASYAKLKAVLTPEQHAKLKELWNNKKDMKEDKKK